MSEQINAIVNKKLLKNTLALVHRIASTGVILSILCSQKRLTSQSLLSAVNQPAWFSMPFRQSSAEQQEIEAKVEDPERGTLGPRRWWLVRCDQVRKSPASLQTRCSARPSLTHFLLPALLYRRRHYCYCHPVIQLQPLNDHTYQTLESIKHSISQFI